jgi:hypothetical protein
MTLRLTASAAEELLHEVVELGARHVQRGTASAAHELGHAAALADLPWHAPLGLNPHAVPLDKIDHVLELRRCVCSLGHVLGQ